MIIMQQQLLILMLFIQMVQVRIQNNSACNNSNSLCKTISYYIISISRLVIPLRYHYELVQNKRYKYILWLFSSISGVADEEIQKYTVTQNLIHKIWSFLYCVSLKSKSQGKRQECLHDWDSELLFQNNMTGYSGIIITGKHILHILFRLFSALY